MEITTDALAYWFFRLNGFLTIINFIVHPEFRRDTSTDVDILAARFPYRRENLRRSMRDSPLLPLQTDRPLVLIAEVKLGLCDLNGPWTREDARNLYKLISAIGVVTFDEARYAAASLQATGVFSSTTAHTSLLCIGARTSQGVTDRYPDVPQITWAEILEFIHSRFHSYSSEKAWTGQWDRDGKSLFHLALATRTPEQYVEVVRVIDSFQQ